MCIFVANKHIRLLGGGLEEGYADRSHDVLGGAAAGEVVHRLGEALEVGADRVRAAEALGDLVADVAGVEVGEMELTPGA